MRQERVFSRKRSVNKAESDQEQLILYDEIVRTIIKERFLKDYIFGVGDSEESFRMYCSTFGMDRDTQSRMILFNAKSNDCCDDLVYIREAVESGFDNKNIVLSTSLRLGAMLIVRDDEAQDMQSILEYASDSIRKRYNKEVRIVYSCAAPISDIPEMFKRLMRCLEYSFYREQTDVICEDIIKIRENPMNLNPDCKLIEEAVSGGDEKLVVQLLDGFFSEIMRHFPSPAVAKTYCLGLYVCIIRCCETEKIDVYMQSISTIQKADSFRAIKTFIKTKALEITNANAPKTVNIYSSLIKDTIRIIEENIGNEKLSLRWIAGTILYTNVDYLGKIFKKETGMNFSHYVMEKRMELAKQFIVDGKKDRIYEVAEKVGYGSNSQYFSQVFKKYTGISPLEYKEIARMGARPQTK